jgi:hypothetical protein
MMSVTFNRKRSGSGMVVATVSARGFDVGKSVKTEIDGKMCKVFWRDPRTLLIDAWPHDIATVISENGTIQFAVMRYPAARKSA